MRPCSASDNLWFLLKFELFWEQQGGNESVLDTRPSQVAWGFEEHVFGLLSSNVLRDKKKKKHFATGTDRSRCLSVPFVSFAGNDSSHRHDWHSVFPPSGQDYTAADCFAHILLSLMPSLASSLALDIPSYQCESTKMIAVCAAQHTAAFGESRTRHYILFSKSLAKSDRCHPHCVNTSDV